MSAHFTGASGAVHAPGRLVHVGRSDGRLWPTRDIQLRWKSIGYETQIGDLIIEDISQVSDEETRKVLTQWKVAVGTGLSEQLGWPKDVQYQLVFPAHFCLRWHNPAGELNTLPLASSARGRVASPGLKIEDILGPDKEACLYGHPASCTDGYVYKYPHEFIPHVLWLLSDSEDHKQCMCKPCHRATGRQVPKTFQAKMDEQAAALENTRLASTGKEARATTKKATKASAASKKKAAAAAAAAAAATAASAASSPAGPATKASVSGSATTKAAKDTAPAPAPVKTTKKAAAPKAAPATNPAPVAAVPPAAPTPAVTPAATPARHPALNDEPTLFRRGEMVWYQQEPAWRIGIIRYVGSGQTTIYTVVPLGHALLNLPDVQKQAAQMRPFLTFSVPAMSIPILHEKTFNQVNWQGLLDDPNYQGRGEVVGLEASKLAAIEIDGSWSTFNHLPAGPKQSKNQSFYGGVFLGAEMIRLGDPIRPKEKNRGTLLEVTEISVTLTTTAPNQPEPAANPPSSTQVALSFRGIEYEACLVPETGRVPAQPEGAIFRKDTAFRTSVAKAGGQKQKLVWTIKSWDTTWQERDVAGRSYVTDELIGVTQGAEAVEKAKQTGSFQEASAYLNNRMQNAASRNFGRRANRRATVGAAVASAQPLDLGEGVMEE